MIVTGYKECINWSSLFNENERPRGIFYKNLEACLKDHDRVLSYKENYNMSTSYYDNIVIVKVIGTKSKTADDSILCTWIENFTSIEILK